MSAVSAAMTASNPANAAAHSAAADGETASAAAAKQTAFVHRNEDDGDQKDDYHADLDVGRVRAMRCKRKHKVTFQLVSSLARPVKWPG